MGPNEMRAVKIGVGWWRGMCPEASAVGKVSGQARGASNSGERRKDQPWTDERGILLKRWGVERSSIDEGAWRSWRAIEATEVCSLGPPSGMRGASKQGTVGSFQSCQNSRRAMIFPVDSCTAFRDMKLSGRRCVVVLGRQVVQNISGEEPNQPRRLVREQGSMLGHTKKGSVILAGSNSGASKVASTS